MKENNGQSCEIGGSSCCSSENKETVLAKEHWEKTYKNSQETKLGWYQESAQQSLDLINETNIDKDDLIVDIGSGASVFIDNLLECGFNHIIATDISENALNITKNRLSNNDLPKVNFIVDDLTRPSSLNELKNVSIWHDRAVFHFLTEEKERQTYFDLLNNSVKVGGYVILATFNLEGAQKCSGLPVERYDAVKIAQFLGENYKMIHSFDFDYSMPSGDVRPYVYTLFRKK